VSHGQVEPGVNGECSIEMVFNFRFHSYTCLSFISCWISCSTERPVCTVH
jgi:hypothetical protein